jgi:hypothetical protein
VLGYEVTVTCASAARGLRSAADVVVVLVLAILVAGLLWGERDERDP